MSSVRQTVFAALAWMLALGFLAPFPALVQANPTYLEPEAAFRFSARMTDPKTIEVTYQIADGYYMYRERFAFRAGGATLGEPVLPEGKIKFDETFNKDVETYRNQLRIMIPVEASGPFTLIATSQGCADAGLCYSPMDSEKRLSPTGGGLLAAITGQASSAAPSATASPAAVSTPPAAEPPRSADASEQGRIEAALNSGRLLAIVPLFLLLGLGLAFTPCVLPMVPILSSIIIGQGTRIDRGKAFGLSLSYVLGMALVYTLLGIAAGLVGEGLAAALQNPWTLGAFALLMVLLALSMFGFYELQLPSGLQTRLARLSDARQGGKIASVFSMGAISALIVSPCVAAPLAGALLYISQTRDVVVGGGALFSMALGMGIPLLLVGLSAGTLLPRAGAWMASVKRLFGVLMLGMALYIISPVLPAWLSVLGWAALAIGCAAYLLATTRQAWPARLAGVLLGLFGVVQLVGLATGGRDVLAPLAHLGPEAANRHVSFQRIKTSADLDRIVASANGKQVMLDFYADWCVSCKEMEKFTFTDARVRERLDQMILLQADVTANDADDKALLKRFRLFGPPGIIFFDAQGSEIADARVIGYQNPAKFLASLDRAAGRPQP